MLKRILYLIFVLMLAACGGIGLNAGVRGSGIIKTESRSVSDITAVELNTSGDLTLMQGATEALTIEADDNILPMLTSEVNNGRLVLGTRPNTSYTTVNPVKYTLTVKDIQVLMVNGTGDASVDSLSTDNFRLELNGSGDLTINSLVINNEQNIAINGSGDAVIGTLTANTLIAVLNGSGQLTVAGSADSQQVNISGSGNYNAENLETDTATVTTVGSGSANIKVNTLLNATISGSGSINYSGNPQVQQSDTGSGSINQRG